MILTVKQWLAEKSKQEIVGKRESVFSGILNLTPLTGQINLKYDIKLTDEDYLSYYKSSYAATREEPSEIPISFKLK